MPKRRPPRFKRDARVGVFVSCTTNLFRPSVIRAAVQLLEHVGYSVEVPAVQGCCGLLSLRASELGDARDQAKDVISRFQQYDYVAVVSPFCGQVFERALSPLLAGESEVLDEMAAAFSKRCFEVGDLLLAAKSPLPAAGVRSRIAFLDTSEAPSLFGSQSAYRQLLGQMDGIEVIDLPQMCARQVKGAPDGTIAPDLGAGDLAHVLGSIRSCGAGVVASTDLALMMELATHLRQSGSAIELRPVLEVLAGEMQLPAVGQRARRTASEVE